MGLIADLFQRKSVPQEKVDSSLKMLDRLKANAGAETGKYLSLMIDPRQIPQRSEPSTIADLDDKPLAPTGTYVPPTNAVVYQSAAFTAYEAGADTSAMSDPIAAGVNLFFDEFARVASQHNANAKDPQCAIGIERPTRRNETLAGGKEESILHACLHTANWGLFFFGCGPDLNIYLLPFEKGSSLAYKDVQSDGGTPFLSVTTSTAAAGLQWFVAGRLFTRDHIPNLSKQLLEDLTHAESNSAIGTH
jgi:hypothetical protein